MTRFSIKAAVAAAGAVLVYAAAVAQTETELPEPLYLAVSYDEGADPAADLAAAAEIATATDRRILMEVGGEWCAWCHILDHFIETNDDVRAELQRSFVIVKVHWSQEVQNTEFLSNYPEIPGYPHFFVHESDGAFAYSQGTLELEDGEDSYNRDAMLGFALAWRKPGREP